MNIYFQDELNLLRDTGREFARLNPKLAKYLSETSTDPDVERLLEGFAFLTSRIRAKLDDELPELTHSIIQLLWPNFLRPFPPSAVLKFSPVDHSITERQVVPRGSEVLSRPVDGHVCRFQTTADCAIYPLEIEDTQLERTRDRSRITIDLKTLSDLPLVNIKLQDLRLWFTGSSSVAQMLYLWSQRYLKSVRVVPKDRETGYLLPKDSVRPGGFGAEEAVLPNGTAAFDGYRLLQEYFVLPEKFYCVDILGLQSELFDPTDTEFSLEFEFERPVPPEVKLRPENIRLYCSPIVNLFAFDSEPLSISQQKVAYRIRTQGTNADAYEIFSIDDVASWYPSSDGTQRTLSRRYPAFESFEHEIEETAQREQVYYRQRIKAALGRPGFDHELSFVLHNGESAVPVEETLSVQLTCFNRNLAAELAVGDICVTTEVSPAFVSFANITRPTEPVYPPLDGALNWSLISNLSLNYMSLLDQKALAAILTAYDFQAMNNRQAERAARKRLEAILSIDTKPLDRLFRGLPIRGLKSKMSIRESCFETEGEMYLFASVLAEFFRLYATVNSFHELEVHGEERGEVYRWPAKIGRQPLI